MLEPLQKRIQELVGGIYTGGFYDKDCTIPRVRDITLEDVLVAMENISMKVIVEDGNLRLVEEPEMNDNNQPMSKTTIWQLNTPLHLQKPEVWAFIYKLIK